MPSALLRLWRRRREDVAGLGQYLQYHLPDGIFNPDGVEVPGKELDRVSPQALAPFIVACRQDRLQ
jgi:hypothetical protein